MSPSTATRTPRTHATPTSITVGTLSTPIGDMAVGWHDETVVGVFMAAATKPGRWDTAYREGDPVAFLEEHLTRRFGSVACTRVADGAPLDALRRYFGGELDAIDDVPADPGGTPLQSAIWSRLREIPAGRTMTYGELARAVERPKASRAAGRAVGTNPIPIIVPCHRIVGADGTLTGFGGGLERKRWLLDHEGARRELV